MPTSKGRTKNKKNKAKFNAIKSSKKIEIIQSPNNPHQKYAIYDGEAPQLLSHSYPIVCYGCDRPLPGFSIQLDGALGGGNSQYTTPDYICDVCSAVLEAKDTIIREIEDNSNQLTGAVLVIDMNDSHKQDWLNLGVIPGEINLIKEFKVDAMIKMAHDKLILVHPAMSILMDRQSPVKVDKLILRRHQEKLRNQS